ncbi:hypothetical protein [Methanobrevibacter sp.]|jgi:hypothetical protein|uniref:hypothetical protein n=1 Tax=Methanobrevibacter sp. TaxID=66852 RepID=UPI0025EE1731|nr:hypothetical protein [Methanobrevibacter sp.]
MSKMQKSYGEDSKFCLDCGVELVESAVVPTLDPEMGSLDFQLVNRKISEYQHEAKLADSVYKVYVTNGISRLDKINGRFLATQTVKLDIIIEQNQQLIKQNRTIIELLEKLNYLDL